MTSQRQQDAKEMYDDIENQISETIDLLHGVKINKKNCGQLNTRLSRLLPTIQHLAHENYQITPRAYLKLSTLILDIQQYFKKSSIKTMLSTLSKSKMQSEFKMLILKITDFLIEEPIFLPVELKPLSAEGKYRKNDFQHRTPTLQNPFEELSVLNINSHIDNITSWMSENTSLSMQKVNYYAKRFIDHGVWTKSQLHKKLECYPNFLVTVGVAAQDMSHFDDILKLLNGDNLAIDFQDVDVDPVASDVVGAIGGVQAAIARSELRIAISRINVAAQMAEVDAESQKLFFEHNGYLLLSQVVAKIDVSIGIATASSALRTACMLTQEGGGRVGSTRTGTSALTPPPASLAHLSELCRSVVSAMRCFVLDPLSTSSPQIDDIIYWGCATAVNLSGHVVAGHDHNEILGANGACEVVSECFRVVNNRYRSSLPSLDSRSFDEEVLLQMWMCLVGLSRHAGNNSVFSRDSRCSMIAENWRLFSHFGSISIWGCAAVQSLSLHEPNKLELLAPAVSLSVGPLVCDAMDKHLSNPNALLQCLLALQHLVDRADCSALSNRKCCAAIVNCLSASVNEEFYCSLACFAILNISFRNQEGILSMCAAGACGAIIRALTMHPDVETVVEYCLGAIVNMTDPDSSAASVVDEFALKDVGEAISRSLLMMSLDNELLLSLACSVLINLMSFGRLELKIIFGVAGCCEWVVRGLERQMGTPNLVKILCSALIALGEGCEGNIYRFGWSGGCEVVLNTLQVHMDSSTLIGQLLRAAQVLSMSDNNRRIFDSLNYYTIVSKVAKDYVENEQVEDLALGVLARLNNVRQEIIPNTVLEADVSDLLQAGEKLVAINKANYTAIRGVQLLRYAIEKKQEQYAAVVLHLISTLAEGDEGACKMLGALGACSLVCDLLFYHLQSCVVCIAGMEAVCWLARYGDSRETSNPANILELGRNGACKAVVSVWNLHHSSSEYISLWCCRAIANLASDEENVAKFYTNGTCIIVAAIIREYMGSLKIANVAWYAVINMALNEDNNRILGEAGVCESMESTLALRYDDVNAAEWLLIALQNLCLIEENRSRFSNNLSCVSLLMNILEVHLENSTITSYCFMVIQKLALSRSLVCNMGEKGLCASVVRSTIFHQDDQNTLEDGIIAMAKLSEGNESNTRILSSSGACMCVADVIRSVTKDDEFLVECALMLVQNMSVVEESSEELSRTDVCVSLVGIMELFRKSSLIIDHVCFAAVKLMRIEKNKEVFMTESSKEIFKLAAKSYQAPPVIDVLKMLAIDVPPLSRPRKSVAKEKSSSAVANHHAMPSPSSSENLIDQTESPSTGVSVNGPKSPEAAVYALKKSLPSGDQYVIADALLEVAKSAEGSAVRQSDLGKLGACNLVFEALSTNGYSSIVCEAGLRAVCFLSRHGQDKSTASDANNALFHQLLLPSLLVNIMNTHHDDEMVTFFGCKAIMNFGSSANNIKIGQAGGCKSVVAAIKRFMKVETILKQSLWALINLSLDVKNNSMFSSEGCAAITAVLQTYTSDPDICMWALMGLQNLSLNEDNRIAIANNGGCELVIDSILANIASPATAEFGLMALQKLIVQKVNVVRANKHGACSVILKVLDYQKSNSLVAAMGWKTILALSIGSTSNMKELQENNVGRVIVESLSFFADMEECVEQALAVVSYLASPDISISLSHELGVAGCCEIVSSLLLRYTSDETVSKAKLGQVDAIGVTYLCLQAISYLAITIDGLNQTKFRNEKCCEQIIVAMTLYLSSEDIAAKACFAMIQLSKNNPINAECFLSAGATSVLVGVLQKNKMSKRVVKRGFEAYYTLLQARSSGVDNALSTDTNAVDTVVNIMRIHHNDETILMHGCRTLYIITSVAWEEVVSNKGAKKDSESAQEYFANSIIPVKTVFSIGEIVVRSMKAYFGNVELVRYSCMTLSKLSSEHRSYLRNVGAISVLVRNLRENSTNALVVEQVLRVLLLMDLGAMENKQFTHLFCREVVSAVMQHSNNVIVVSLAVDAMAELSKNADCTVIIGGAGGCESVVCCLRCHVSSAAVVENTCVCILNLSNNSENVDRFGSAGICEVLTNALHVHRGHTTVAEACCNCVIQLAVLDANKSRFIVAGMGLELASAIRLNRTPRLSQVACESLHLLCSAHDSLCAHLCCEIVLFALMSTLAEFPHHETLSLLSMKTLHRLACANSTAMLKHFASNHNPSHIVLSDTIIGNIACNMNSSEAYLAVATKLLALGFAFQFESVSSHNSISLPSLTNINVLVAAASSTVASVDIIRNIQEVVLICSISNSKAANTFNISQINGLREMVTQSFVSYLHDPTIAKTCIQLSKLIVTRDPIGFDFDSDDIFSTFPKLLVESLLHGLLDHKCQVHAFEFLLICCESSEASNESVGVDVGFCSASLILLTQALSSSADNSIESCEVVLCICLCLSRLAIGHRNKELLARQGVTKTIAEIFPQFVTNTDITISCCRTVINIFQRNSDDETLMEAEHSRLCETLVKAINLHVKNADVCRMCCWAITVLAAYDFSKKNLVCSGAMLALLSAISAHESDCTVLELVLLAVINLADHNYYMKDFLSEPCGTEEIFRCLFLHKLNVKIVELGCMALVNFTAGSVAQIKSSNMKSAASIIIELMDLHKQNVTVVIQACWSIANIIDTHGYAAEVFGALSAGSSIIHALKLHVNSSFSVLEHGLQSLLKLTHDNVPNTESFTAQGGFSLTTQIVSDFPHLPEVMEIALSLVCYVMEYYCTLSTEELEVTLEPLVTIYDAVVNAALSNSESSIIAEKCSSIILDLSIRANDDLVAVFDRSRACEVVANTLKTHFLIENVVLSAAPVIEALTQKDAESQNALQYFGVFDGIRTVLEAHNSNIDIVHRMARAIYTVVANNSSNLVMARSSGVCLAMLSIYPSLISSLDSDATTLSVFEISRHFSECVVELCKDKENAKVLQELQYLQMYSVILNLFIEEVTSTEALVLDPVGTCSIIASCVSVLCIVCGEGFEDFCEQSQDLIVTILEELLSLSQVCTPAILKSAGNFVETVIRHRACLAEVALKVVDALLSFAMEHPSAPNISFACSLSAVVAQEVSETCQRGKGGGHSLSLWNNISLSRPHIVEFLQEREHSEIDESLTLILNWLKP